MQQTRPRFIIKKYRSILFAALAIEAVNFIVSLTDSIVAGNAVDAEALAAIGLITPLITVAVFLATVVNTGTVLQFSYRGGKFEKERADAFFSQGVCTAILMGAVYALALLLFGETVSGGLASSETVRGYLRDYYYVILLSVLLAPISFLLDNMLIADGAEKLSVAANTTQIVCNVVFSVWFVQLWGVTGIALATVLSRGLFLLIACLHFFGKKNTLRFRLRWSFADFAVIVKGGIVKAANYGFEAILMCLVNAFAVRRFGQDALIVLVIVERVLGLLTLFVGLSMACQPLVGTLRGEKNTKTLRYLMKTALRDMVVIGGCLSVLIIACAPLIVPAFGITSGAPLYAAAVAATRIVSATLAVQAVLILFFAYFVFIDKQLLPFVICLLNNLLSSAGLAITLALVLHSQVGMWIGFAAAPVFAAAVSALIVVGRYGTGVFPFLIGKERDDRIFIYDFPIDAESSVGIAETVEKHLQTASVPTNTCVLAGVITEDMLMVIAEKNAASGKPLYAECTVIDEDDGVRVILRDSGMIFDITDADAKVESFRRYVVSNLMLKQDRKLYLTTTGYNRNELLFQKTGSEA